MERYRLEMDQLGPRPEKLEELYDMIEGGNDMKQAKRIGRKAAAAILLAAALTVTAAAAAAPAVWQALSSQLGAFAPYAQTVRGAVCRDQGIKVQVLSALADDLEARFYISVQDIEADRLDEQLTLTGKIANGVKKETDGSSSGLSLISGRNSRFDLISYDPETKTALFSTSIDYWNDTQPEQDAHLSLTGMTTKKGQLYGNASCAAVTGQTLESLPVGAQDKVVFSITDISGLECTEAVLPASRVVLAPEQNPIPMEGTQDMWVSSMGFASDGRFHVRLGLADGIIPAGPKDQGGTFFSDLFRLDRTDGEKWFVFHATLVPNGLDIMFPLFTTEDLEELKTCNARFYGPYTRPGIDIEGSWNIDFPLEYYPSATLDWTGELAGRQVSKVTLSPLSVTMSSNDSGAFSRSTLYAVKKDGSTVAAEPDKGSYGNIGGIDPIWDAFNTWKFAEPVDLEEVVSLSLMDGTIPVG